jgi:hypothetical protein
LWKCVPREAFVFSEEILKNFSIRRISPMDKNFIPVLFLLLFLCGCVAAKPMVSMEEGAFLKTYKVFQVAPAINETGETFEFDVTGELTNKVKLRLTEKGYKVEEVSASEGVLVIKNSLMDYEAGNAAGRWLAPGVGVTQATVKTSLIDKTTGTIIGEMVTSESVSGGGLFSVGAYKQILDTIAKGIANEIDTRMKSQ